MSSQYISEIRIMAFDFPPRGWALCNGTMMSIQQNTALFSLIGTYYGGNGTNNFKLPDLQGRVPLHMGTGFDIGSNGGEVTHTLIPQEMAPHTHAVRASTSSGNGPPSPIAVLAQGLADTSPTTPVNVYATLPVVQNAGFAPSAISPSGGNGAHPNVQPNLVLNFCISLIGIFPSRS